jgi:ATP-dependent Lon protease
MNKYPTNNFIQFIDNKIIYYNELMMNTIHVVNKYKSIDILSASELNVALNSIEKIHSQIDEIEKEVNDLNNVNANKKTDDILALLQKCNDSFYSLFKDFGTKNISDILNICFGSKYIDENILSSEDTLLKEKYKLLDKFSMPIHFKVIQWKNGKTPNMCEIKKNKIVEDSTISDTASNLDCFDMARNSKHFQSKVYGTKVCFQNYDQRKTIIICCLCDNTMINCIRNYFLKTRINSLMENIPSDGYFKDKMVFFNFVNSLTIKELCVYNNKELYNRFVGYINQGELMKQKPISQLVKEFINSDLYSQRNTLIQLLIHGENPEYNYISYLLYDLLSNDDKGIIDTKEQTNIFDSLPWNIKRLFKNAMRTTIDYTKTLVNIDNNKIPLEQQICLMKVNDSVKEKAMVKLKEVKAKSEDSGSKARQYLDGLLKIPFGVYKEEPILKQVAYTSSEFEKYVKNYNLTDILQISDKKEYSTLEIQNGLQQIKDKIIPVKLKEITESIDNLLCEAKRNELIELTQITNKFIKKNNISYKKIIHSAKKNNYLINSLYTYYKYLLEKAIKTDNFDMLRDYLNVLNIKNIDFFEIKSGYEIVKDKWSNVKTSMSNIRSILDDAVYGHENAKRQIERVIGQWMSGNQKGYCFGFEGPPGLGKTSIAKKGLAKCLVDENGEARPFGFIAIGGSSNSSTLDGHNYTYVGSTWGRIVDILMESKCMNPIIFIDELDKISKTEQGKEIIGILTHLVDPSQNDEFHDKYFSGIDIDLSKVLFVFSYNDVGLLDRILLDRIHRVQFKNLSLEEKVVITRKHLLPEIYEKIKLNGMITISDDVIRHIIEKYTMEPGVRKLKEILFEILSEINLEILHNNSQHTSLVGEDNGIVLTINSIHDKYLKERREIKEKKIHTHNEVGIINGLWANSMGQGGIIPIQCNYFPTSNFLELKLTGMQGDVMKESMNVSKTLAYRMTSKKTQKELLTDFKETNMQGLHIHCPEGAVPKDGPSAGTAITTTIYSLLNNKKIKNNVAITGEINLQGCVTAIGGLDLKILGGIKAGVTEFIYPKENHDDFVKFNEKYGGNSILHGIQFYEVEHIDEVMKLVFEK